MGGRDHFSVRAISREDETSAVCGQLLKDLFSDNGYKVGPVPNSPFFTGTCGTRTNPKRQGCIFVCCRAVPASLRSRHFCYVSGIWSVPLEIHELCQRTTGKALPLQLLRTGLLASRTCN